MSEESTAPGQKAVVLASFENRRAGKRMVGSLGRAFRTKARGGDATALVVGANKDGSLKMTQSRLLEAGDATAAVIRAHERGADAWDGSLADFLDALDPGPRHDWMREARCGAGTSKRSLAETHVGGLVKAGPGVRRADTLKGGWSGR